MLQNFKKSMTKKCSNMKIIIFGHQLGFEDLVLELVLDSIVQEQPRKQVYYDYIKTLSVQQTVPTKGKKIV